MNKHTLTKTAAAAAIAVAAAMGSAISVAAATDITPTISSLAAESKESLTTKRKILEERQQKIAHEALEAITGTQNALIALQQKDTKTAKTLLRGVSSKLDILLKKNPGLALVPANMEADVYEFDGDASQVQKVVDAAGKLLTEHKVQDARTLLADLVSEISVTTTSIPLGTYPVAIKDAVSFINQGKMTGAEETLHDVLNMLVKTTETIPLPLLHAEALLTAASELEHKGDLTKEASRTEILKLTDAAKDKLKLAETLGYGVADDYKQLYTAIDEIKDVIHSEKSAAVWEKIKNSLSTFKNKIIRLKK